MAKDKNKSFGMIGELFPIEEQQTYEIQFDKIRILLKKINKIWYIWSTQIENSQFIFNEINNAKKTKDLGWEQFVGKSKNNFTLKPLMPDKAIVLRPDSSVTILPGEKVEYFISIPIWLGMYIKHNQKDVILKEFPVTILSDTWFGDPITGELCYSIDYNFTDNYQKFPETPDNAICPIIIKNNSPAPLVFQRLCVRCIHLKIYKGEKHLWTNQVDVNFRGPDQISQVTFSKLQPSYETELKLISPERVTAESNLLKKVLVFSKTITNI